MVTNTPDKEAVAMAREIIAIAQEKAKYGSASREIAYALILARLGRSDIDWILDKEDSRERIQKHGLMSELDIKEEKYLTSELLFEKRGKLIREAGRLYDEAALESDPFTIIEKVIRIMEILLYIGFSPAGIGIWASDVDSMFTRSYDKIKEIGPGEVMARYKNSR